MAKRGRRKPKIQLTAGNDPRLHRFATLEEALSASTAILSELVRRTIAPTATKEIREREISVIGGD